MLKISLQDSSEVRWCYTAIKRTWHCNAYLSLLLVTGTLVGVMYDIALVINTRY